jgi:hypothetical protein
MSPKKEKMKKFPVLRTFYLAEVFWILKVIRRDVKLTLFDETKIFYWKSKKKFVIKSLSLDPDWIRVRHGSGFRKILVLDFGFGQ